MVMTAHSAPRIKHKIAYALKYAPPLFLRLALSYINIAYGETGYLTVTSGVDGGGGS